MREDGPIDLRQVLAEEYRALRPGGKLESQSEAEWLSKVHGEAQPLGALCISGGGIRSATFALGAIQGLAEQGLLDQFDYLSTVSGGGYIGSWLTAWIKRAGGLEKVIPNLCRNAKPPGEGEPDPIGHLRDYNNYLSPKLGFFSADTWTLVATVVRNIILNWLVLVPLLMFALMIPRLLVSIAAIADIYWEVHGTADPISTSPFVTVGLPVVSALLLAFSLFNTARYLPGVGGRDHSQGDFLAKVLAPLIGAALCFCSFDSLYFWRDKSVTTSIPELIAWVLIPSAAGCLAYVLFCPNSLRARLHLLFGPLPVAVVLMAICTGAMEWVLTSKLVLLYTTWAQYVTISPPLLLLAFDLAMTVFVGLSSTVLKDEDREWLARSSAWTQLFCITWAAVCALVLLAPGWAFQWKTWAQALFAAAGAASGWASRIAGAAAETGPKGEKAGFHKSPLGLALKLAPAAFLVTFSVGLSALTNWLLYRTGAVSAAWWDHDEFLVETGWHVVVASAAILFGFGWVMARFININRFSLQGMYRNRLIRAYLGASNPKRNTSRFTGFAESDNLPMRDLRTGFKPFHVVNMALNLVRGARLAWQQRKAQSFTVSPLHSGNYELGYRDSAAYAGPDGITLGTAVAISGAAASPNMGYHSSPIMGFIMTLFNARLGSWLGNPGKAGRRTWTQPGPRSAFGSLLKEAFGLTTNTSSYVYLSDGGHFENLGLYEMVLRRCRHIVVFDSASDPAFSYEDLGNAVRKIRIDLRIPIDFPDEYMQPMLRRKKRCAVGAIRYSEVDGECPDGLLIYIKPMRLGDEPPDVESYAVAHPAFPHQGTADQWFDESQTESYRMLGLHTLDEICRGWKGGGLSEFAQHVQEEYLKGK